MGKRYHILWSCLTNLQWFLCSSAHKNTWWISQVHVLCQSAIVNDILLITHLGGLYEGIYRWHAKKWVKLTSSISCWREIKGFRIEMVDISLLIHLTFKNICSKSVLTCQLFFLVSSSFSASWNYLISYLVKGNRPHSLVVCNYMWFFSFVAMVTVCYY